MIRASDARNKHRRRLYALRKRGIFEPEKKRRKRLRKQWDTVLDVIRIKKIARNRLRDRHYDRMEPHIRRARAAGATNYAKLAKYLNQKGLKDWRGRPWTRSRLSHRSNRQKRRLLDQRVTRGA